MWSPVSSDYIFRVSARKNVENKKVWAVMNLHIFPYTYLYRRFYFQSTALLCFLHFSSYSLVRNRRPLPLINFSKKIHPGQLYSRPPVYWFVASSPHRKVVLGGHFDSSCVASVLSWVARYTFYTCVRFPVNSFFKCSVPTSRLDDFICFPLSACLYA